MELPNLYVYSTSGFCGKSAIILGLALKFKEEGYKVGYFKPMGLEMVRGTGGEKIDQDAKLMERVLNLNLPPDVISPIIFGSSYFEETTKTDSSTFEKKIFQAYEKASKNMDLMILEGPPSLGMGASLGIDTIVLAKKFKSNLLLVALTNDDASIERIIWRKTCTEARDAEFSGVILNSIPKTSMERIKGLAVPILKKNSVNVFGIIPDNIELRAPTIREICERVSCNVLTCEDKLDNLVEDFLVGAMTPEAALTYFRRSLRKAVITGGDRVDIQLAALQTDTAVLILTGNIYPDIRVLARAEELGVPVLLVPVDTYTTIKNITTLIGRIKPNDTKKIELAKKQVEDYVNWKEILKILHKDDKDDKSEDP